LFKCPTDFIQRTIDLATKNVKEGGRPFACLIVKDGKVLKASANLVAQTNDPTGFFFCSFLTF
jgi:guanine deaminase